MSRSMIFQRHVILHLSSYNQHSQDLLIKHKEILASFLVVPITIANFDAIELWSYSVSSLLQLSSPM
uniref:Uncharacterized protein n=1 Tax=Solanum tuberosum TaxID=4113 RepID=M0ZW53_SOLTU